MARRSTNVNRLEAFLGNDWRAWQVGENGVAKIEGSDGIYTITGTTEGTKAFTTTVQLDLVQSYTVL